jgi:YidC/Oxa1 family membrane protein insertase
MNSNFLKFSFFALLLFLGFRLFFSPKTIDKNSLVKQRVDVPGQEFRAPVSKLETQPLLRDVDFEHNEIYQDAEEVVLYTKNCDYYFSSYGAALSGVEFKDYKNEFGQPIRTVYSQQRGGQQLGSFLVILDKDTPFEYVIDGQGRDEHGFSWVEFKAENNLAKITKTFCVSDRDYSLEMKLEIHPKKSAIVKPRIIFEAPRLGGLLADKAVAVTLGLDGKSLVQIDKEKEPTTGWKLPEIFGAHDQYFLNALFAQNLPEFVQRGYLQRIDDKEIACFIEGQELTDPTAVTLKFYVGPKAINALKSVDARLIGVLSLGFLASVCELLINLIEWFYKIVGNYGLAIILVALVARFVFMPISFFARRRFNQIANFERVHASELALINRQFKDDWVKKNEEIDKFYKKYGRSQTEKMVNMLPLLFEAPLFFASYKIFTGYVSFYNAPLIFWIKDLSVKDPYLLLPILFGLSSILKETLSLESSQKGFSLSKFLVPMVLVAVFSGVPAGLVLFMLFNSLFSALEILLFDFALKRI